MEISKEEFERFEEVRKSDKANMLNVSKVCGLSDLSRKKVLFIIRNYNKFHEEYPEVVKR